MTITDSDGNAVGFVGAGVGLSYAVSATTADLIDINGDGLPDHVTVDGTGTVRAHLNLGNRFSGEIPWSATPWLTQSVSNQQDWVNRFGDDLRADSLRLQDTSSNNASLNGGGNTGGFGFGAGGALNDTMLRQLVDIVDVNGDGLPDKVMRSPKLTCSTSGGIPCMRVKLNLGDRFAPEQEIPLASWPAGASLGAPGTLAGLGLGDADGVSFTIGSGSSGSVTFSGQTYIFEYGGTTTWASEDNQTSQAFEDIDGDGTMDQVLKANGNATVYARINQTGKTNLLKHVSRPLGGGFDLDYSREGNQVDSTVAIDNPRNQWVLSKVSLDDGRVNCAVHPWRPATALPTPSTTRSWGRVRHRVIRAATTRATNGKNTGMGT